MKVRLAPDQNLHSDSKDIEGTIMMCSETIRTCQSDDCHLHCCCAGTGLFGFAVAGGF